MFIHNIVIPTVDYDVVARQSRVYVQTSRTLSLPRVPGGKRSRSVHDDDKNEFSQKHYNYRSQTISVGTQ